MSINRRNVALAVASLVACRLFSSPARADRGRGRHGNDDDDDHGAAARARASGEIRPLMEIIEHIGKSHPGEIVGIELERDDGQWIYEIKVVTPEGRLFEIDVDARDKRVIKVEGK